MRSHTEEELLPQSPARDVTELLLAWREGDSSALDALMPVVYGELRRLAHRNLRQGSSDCLLQTTALVHEAYLRLLGSSRVSWQNRAHFFALSAKLMRRVLVDAVRTRRAQKRGGHSPHVSIDGVDGVSDTRHPSLVALDEALTALAVIDARKARVVELRYFGGLSEAEVGEVLGVSLATVERDWRIARLWLSRELNGKSA